MRKEKQKLIAIIALTLSVLGLTLGFAAFSNTLTISSSATVTPDSGDFKLVFYGVENDKNFDQTGDPMTEITSPVKSEPRTFGKVTATTAIIDNESLTIKNINVAYTEPGDTVAYNFKIVNEGKYTVYITKDDFKEFADSLANKTCVAKAGTTDSLVQEACKNIDTGVLSMEYTDNGGQFDSQYMETSSDYMELPVGGYADLYIHYYYSSSNSTRADGDFEVIYSDAKLNYSTVKPAA